MGIYPNRIDASEHRTVANHLSIDAGYGVQFIFALCCVVAWFFVWKFVPETKGTYCFHICSTSSLYLDMYTHTLDSRLAGVSLESMSLLFNPSSASATDPRTNPLVDPEYNAAVARQEDQEVGSASDTDFSERGQSQPPRYKEF